MRSETESRQSFGDGGRKAKCLSVFLSFCFLVAVSASCCGKVARKMAMYPKPDNTAQKIANYIIKNGEQTCTKGVDLYQMVTMETSLIYEHTNVLIAKKYKDLNINVEVRDTSGVPAFAFNLYDRNLDGNLDRYLAIFYDKNGKKIQEMLFDLEKNQLCVEGECADLPKEFFDEYQQFYKEYLETMAEDLEIK